MRQKPEPEAPSIPGALPKKFLAAGGFADVFLYEQQVPKRDVAVKVIRQGADEKARAQFETEANLMAQFSSHPAILSVYGAGTIQGDRNYLMLEYCPPPDLGKRCVETPLRVTAALEIAIQICGAVETIHRAGYLHRDIKPSNILVTSYNRAVLTDFGIASPINTLMEEDFGGASLPWASPEQQLDEQLTPASDVYSLSATIYTLLAGRSPHVDPSEQARNDQLSMLNRVLHKPIPPIGSANVPEQLEQVLFTALNKDPKDRYSSAWSFARALQQVQTDLQMQVTDLDVLDYPSIQAGAGEQTQNVFGPGAVSASLRGQAVASARENQSPADSTHMAPRRVQAQPVVRARPITGEPVVNESTTENSASAAATVPVANPLTLPDPLTQTPQRRRSSPRSKKRAVVVGVLAAALLLAISGVGVRSYLRGEGEATATSATATVSSVVDIPPGTANLPAVTGLTVKLNAEGKVSVSWLYDSDYDVTFVYFVDDPEKTATAHETKKTKATVDPISGRTCVSVQARVPSGLSSNQVVRCVDTP